MGASNPTNGVRLNTDAIDNSAGVDMSDHEVNLKILLDRVVERGELSETTTQRTSGGNDRGSGHISHGQ